MSSKLVLLLVVTISLDSINAQAFCFVCNPNSGFACLTSGQYVNCDVNGAPDFSEILECDFEDEVCDYNIRIRPCTMEPTPTCPLSPFLTPAPTTTAVPTTSASTAATTTTNNPNQICENKPAGSRYPHGEGCKQYIYCYMNNGLKGAIYSCQSTTLFDPTLQQCVTGYAEMCTT